MSATETPVDPEELVDRGVHCVHRLPITRSTGVIVTPVTRVRDRRPRVRTNLTIDYISVIKIMIVKTNYLI